MTLDVSFCIGVGLAGKAAAGSAGTTSSLRASVRLFVCTRMRSAMKPTTVSDHPAGSSGLAGMGLGFESQSPRCPATQHNCDHTRPLHQDGAARCGCSNAAAFRILKVLQIERIRLERQFTDSMLSVCLRIDSPYLLLSDGSLPHRKCYPICTHIGGGDEETNQVDDASGTGRGYQPPLPSSGSK
jgi:hypothetical protein